MHGPTTCLCRQCSVAATNRVSSSHDATPLDTCIPQNVLFERNTCVQDGSVSPSWTSFFRQCNPSLQGNDSLITVRIINNSFSYTNVSGLGTVDKDTGQMFTFANNTLINTVMHTLLTSRCTQLSLSSRPIHQKHNVVFVHHCLLFCLIHQHWRHCMHCLRLTNKGT